MTETVTVRACFKCEGWMEFLPGRAGSFDLDGWYCEECDTWIAADQPGYDAPISPVDQPGRAAHQPQAVQLQLFPPDD